MSDNKEKVLAVMKSEGRPLKAGEIVELSGLDRKEVDLQMKILKKEEAIVSGFSLHIIILIYCAFMGLYGFVVRK